ncbi:MAG: hypothetical protein LKK13_00660 [Bacilli bacterium]|nr:hypothetical protein [Bacilli bacterium]
MKSNKSKFLAVLMLPTLLVSCSSAIKPTVLGSIGTNNSVVKNAYVVDAGGGGGSASGASNYQSTGYPSVYGKETHKSTVTVLLGTAPTVSDVSFYHDTGVKIYGGNTSTSVGSTSDIKIASSCPYIDFNEVNFSLPYSYSSQLTLGVCAVADFKFEICKGSSRYFIAEATAKATGTDNKQTQLTYNRNGSVSSSIVDSVSTTNYTPFDYSKLGRISSSLYSGSYTINVTYSYEWIAGSGAKMALVSSTATNSATLLIDYTSPTISMVKTSSGTVIPNGGTSNSTVKVTASDTNLNGLYYKIPSSSYYTYSGSGSCTTSAGDGIYSFYAVDSLGNRSADYTVRVDTYSPNGQLYANGVAISSGSYVNTSFSYSVSDSGSGLNTVLYKTPSSSSFVSYSSGSIIPSNSGDGWYQFYAVDNAGNVSSTLKVFLETSNPTISIKRNGITSFGHTMTKNETLNTGLYFNEDDTIRFDYSSSSNKYTTGAFSIGTNYALKKTSYPNNTYSETITSAVGISTTYKFNIVRNKPTITLNGTQYANGSVIKLNKDANVTMNIDSIITSGSSKGTVKSTGLTNTYDLLSNREVTLTADANEEKVYQIFITDSAGNESTFTVDIDKAPANGVFTSGGAVVENGGYTNKPFTFTWTKAGTTATMSKDGSGFTDYTGFEITADGSYTFILKDSVGNTSEFRIVLDTIAPTGTIYANNKEAENGCVTNSSIYFTWDGDETCLMNGVSYKKNAVIDTEGIYRFVLKDKAGNETSYEAEIDRTAPTGNEDALNAFDRYYVTKWYECYFNGHIDSFKTYDEAIKKAADYEYSSSVEELSLSDISLFTETNMVSSNGDPENHDDEVRTGTYWLYKSKSNPSIKLYYFDKNLLEDVLKFYASSYVTGPHYYDGTTFPEGENVSDPIWTDDGVSAPIGNDYVLTNYGSVSATAKKQGSDETIVLDYGVKLSEQLKDSGVYDITETDKAGNACTYQVIIDLEGPKLSIHTETYGDDSKDITISKDNLSSTGTYYLKSLSISEILDSDSWAVVSVTKGGKTSYYTKGDALPTITDGGKYEVKAYDRLGNSIFFTVYISSQAETIDFTNNSDDTAVSIDVSMGETYQTITSIEIYRNGQKLDGVSTDKLNYEFTKDGLYRVVLKDNFGRTIKKEYYFHKALPQGVISGVANGGKTSNNVTFEFNASKYYAEIYKDGELISQNNDGSFTIESNAENSGSYEVKLINKTDEENYQVYNFTMDKVAPNVRIEGVEDNGTTNGSVKVGWTDEDVCSSTYSLNGGEEVSFNSDTVFSKEGTYVIKVIDDMGNVTTKTFTIDKTVSYEATTSGGKKIGGDATTSDDVIINAKEDAKITVIKDGEKYDYTFGETLTEEGSYLITVEDAYGNKTSFTIVIDKSVSFDMNVGDGGISNEPVVIDSGETETVIVTRNGEAYGYEAGTEITEEGTYRVIITDAYGNTKEVTFQIVYPDAKTSLDYTLGDDVEIVSVTKDGEAVQVDGNRISFTEDGTYVITYKVGDKEYTFTLKLDTTAPEITLNGVEDGGKVDGSVIIDGLTEEGTVEVYKDGVKIEYHLGDEIKDYGSYKVVVTDALGNARTYTFDLAFQMNGWAIALIAVGILAAVGVTVTIIVKRKKTFKK